MCGLNIGDSKWLRTFPQVVAPLQDECLWGLLLRCDKVNGWLGGTTASLTFLPHYGGAHPIVGSYAVEEDLDLDKLADYLGIPVSLILETTFHSAQLRFFGKPYPIYPNHWRGKGSLQVCPACISEARLIRTSTTLPNVHHCPIHKLILQRRCSCGANISGYLEGIPFSCSVCGLDWQFLPHTQVDPRNLATEERYLSLYTFFLTDVTGLDYRRICSWLGEEHLDRPRDWVHDEECWLTFFIGRCYPFLRWEGKPRLYPLYRVVDTLIQIGATIRDVVLISNATPRYERSCLNHACSLFGTIRAGNIALFGYYQIPSGKNEPIWYCTECGSCYLNYRLCFSFDRSCFGNDSPALYPMLDSIESAQWRLRGWQEELNRVCGSKVRQRKEIEIKEVFKEARIPWKPNLLAPRLGLVQIVQRYGLLQQKRKLKEAPKHERA